VVRCLNLENYDVATCGTTNPWAVMGYQAHLLPTKI